VSKEVITLFSKHKVLSRRELQSRLEIYLEQYVMTVSVEAKLTVEMARTIIYPAAVRYTGELASTGASLKAVGADFDAETLNKVVSLTKSLLDNVSALEAEMDQDEGKSMLIEARHACHRILPAMLRVREVADELEGVVADDLWPLPTYQEILFIK
jgi:glutamine synthetase